MTPRIKKTDNTDRSAHNTIAGQLQKGVISMDKEKIQGINCDVSSCVYNRNSHECVAGRIDVCCTCSEPDCCDETQCKTFKARD
jgi:hypothetical protein